MGLAASSSLSPADEPRDEGAADMAGWHPIGGTASSSSPLGPGAPAASVRALTYTSRAYDTPEAWAADRPTVRRHAWVPDLAVLVVFAYGPDGDEVVTAVGDVSAEPHDAAAATDRCWVVISRATAESALRVAEASRGLRAAQSDLIAAVGLDPHVAHALAPPSRRPSAVHASHPLPAAGADA
jgi:hypothetical protein